MNLEVLASRVPARRVVEALRLEVVEDRGGPEFRVWPICHRSGSGKSFKVNEERDLSWCFACREDGPSTVNELIGLALGCSLAEAIRWREQLGEGVAVPAAAQPRRPSGDGRPSRPPADLAKLVEKARERLLGTPALLDLVAEKLRISERTVRDLGLGFLPKTARRPSRVVFPAIDANGTIRAVKLRLLEPVPGQRKSLGLTGVPSYAFGVPNLVRADPAETVALVLAGEKDFARMHELLGGRAGIVLLSPTHGEGALPPEVAEMLRGWRVAIAYDMDEAGQRGAIKAALKILDAGAAEVRLVLWDPAEGKDVAELVEAGWTAERFAQALRAASVYRTVKELPAPPPRAGRPEEPTLTDTGNAARLVGRHGARLRYIPQWARWVIWDPDEGRWLRDHRDVLVRELAKDVGHELVAAKEHGESRSTPSTKFGLSSLNARRISGMVNLARGVAGIPIDHEDLDRDAWLLGVQNGVIDLRTGQLRPADPRDLMTMQAPVAFDPEAKAPRWERALEEWFPDPEVRAYVHRLAGAALVGVQRDHVLVIHYGDGRNGKGTFVRALQRTLGPYARVIHLSLLVEQRHQEHDTVKADLFRTRLAVASETPRRIRLDEASVKNLTGGDRITARRMNENPWEFDPTHSLWLQTNHLPAIEGRDRGIRSRIRVVKWKATFEGNEEKDLDDTLAAELPGILAWLVRGCQEWRKTGLAEPEAVLRETVAYLHAEDQVVRFADDIGLAFGPGLEIQAGELQNLLTEWAVEQGVKPPRPELRAWLEENDARQTQRRVETEGKKRRLRYWIGVGIPETETEPESPGGTPGTGVSG